MPNAERLLTPYYRTVLVGDPENDQSTGHGVIPRLKLSDFGLSRRIDPYAFDDP